jgi:hypothetical protein
MSDPDSPPPDPIESALADALPGLRSLRIQGLAGMGGLLIITGLLVITLLNHGKDAQTWAMIVGFAGVFGIVALASWVKKSHEAAIMPILASTLNLSHQKTAKYFINQIPETFIPRGGKQTCDDLMSGQIAGRSFSFAEVKTETGGKNSSTLFDGVVIEVKAREMLPEFLIAPVKQTKGFWFFKGNVNVENQSRWHTGYGGDGQEYGLWSPSQQPAERKVMEDLMDRMLRLGSSLAADSSLYSVACTGHYIYVALRHKREMFRIGGVFATHDELMADIRTATSELDVPLRLAAEVVRAEEALHEAAGKPAA